LAQKVWPQATAKELFSSSLTGPTLAFIRIPLSRRQIGGPKLKALGQGNFSFLNVLAERQK
jgi:hypothetical protein